MKKLFIPYETDIPLLAKEKGFDEPCLSAFDKQQLNIGSFMLYDRWREFDNSSERFILQPTYQQLIDWLREKHNINIPYVICGSNKEVLGYKWFVQVGMENQCYETKMIKDYYIGMTEAIKEALLRV